MARTTRESVKERDDPVPCQTCGRPTWSRDRQCVHCRWFGPPAGPLGDPLQLAGPHQGEVLRSTPPLPSGTLSPTGVVLAEVTCRVCGYNLRGLLATGQCPECACPIGRSLWARSLTTADPTWLRRLESGATLLLAGLVILFPGLIVSFVVNTGGVPMSQWAGAACQMLLLLLPALGLLLLTTPEPDRQDEPPSSARRLARGVLLAALAVTVYLPVAPITPGLVVNRVLVSSGFGLYAVGVGCLLLHIRHLFLLATWRSWACLSLVTAIGLAAALGLGSLESIVGIFVSNTSPIASLVSMPTCCGWVLTLPFGVCGIVVLAGLCCCLSRAQQQSRGDMTTAEFEQQRAQ